MSVGTKNKACVVIPIYKAAIDENEKKSLKQALKIFRNYPIIFSHPKKLDLTKFHEACLGFSNCSFKSFADENFLSVETYSALLCQKSFYQKFSEFEFMLIYQLDAYVFADELEVWCSKGLDYVGAPWFKKFDTSGKEAEFLPFAGNGGFSLRNIRTILRVMDRNLSFKEAFKFKKLLKKYRAKPFIRIIFGIGFFAKLLTKNTKFSDFIEYCLKHSDFTFEDFFFAQIAHEMFSEFRSARFDEAIPFSFEVGSERLFKINGNKLPFGCHAWQKYSPEFWSKFIK